MIAGEGEVVALVGQRHPHAGLGAVIEDDLLGEPASEIGLEEDAVRADVCGETVEMVEPADIDAACRETLRLVLQGRLELGRRSVPLRLVIELDQVPVRVAAEEGGAMAEIAVRPADIVAGSFQRRDPALERLLAACPERHVAHAGLLRSRQLERVALVVVPAAQVDGIALAAALGHAHHVDEEAQALVRLGRQQLEMAQMGEVKHRFFLHYHRFRVKIMRVERAGSAHPGFSCCSGCLLGAGSGAAPDLLGDLDDHAQLGPLLVLGERVALLGRGEAALRREAELVEVDIFASPRRCGA